MSLPPRRFPNWIAKYMHYSRHSEAPDAFHFWTAVSTIAGALRRRVWLEESYFQVTPNFYIIFVAPPGIATKSTTVELGMRLLRRIEGVHFGPNSMTWQALTVAMEEAIQAVQWDENRIMQMSCLTIVASELGVFLKVKDDGLIDVLTDMWDGKQAPWEHRTKTAKEGEKTRTQIVNPWMNIIGCTTPAWIRRNFPSYIIEGGLTSRCIFISAKTKRHLVALPHKHINHEEFLAEGDALCEDLNIIAELCGEYRMSPEAEDWMEQWYEKHWGNFAEDGIGDRYSGYMSRKQTHIWKLSMILAASQRNELIITLDDIVAANRFVSSLETDMHKMFETIGANDAARQTTDILQHVRSSGSISFRDLWRLFMPFMAYRDFDAAVKSLVAAGHIATTENERKELHLIAFGSGQSDIRRVVK